MKTGLDVGEAKDRILNLKVGGGILFLINPRQNPDPLILLSRTEIDQLIQKQIKKIREEIADKNHQVWQLLKSLEASCRRTGIFFKDEDKVSCMNSSIPLTEKQNLLLAQLNVAIDLLATIKYEFAR